MNDLSRKIRILTEGIFNTTENDLQEITKIASVKILLKQCLHKGFLSIRSGQTMKKI